MILLSRAILSDDLAVDEADGRQRSNVSSARMMSDSAILCISPGLFLALSVLPLAHKFQMALVRAQFSRPDWTTFGALAANLVKLELSNFNRKDSS